MASDRSGMRGWGVGRAGWAVAVAVGAALLAGLAWRPEATARDEDAPAAKLPPDLARVPRDAIALCCFRLADVWNGEVAGEVRRKHARDMDQAAGEFEKKFGTPLGHVERLTLVVTDVRSEPLFLIATDRPFNKEKVVAAAGPGALEEKRKDHTLYVGGSRAVHLIGRQAFVIGRAQEVRSLLDQEPRKVGPLDEALRLAADKHLAVVGVNPGGIDTDAFDRLKEMAGPFKPLLEARSGTLTFDVGERARANVRAHFAKEADAREGVQALQTALDFGRKGLGQQIKMLSKQKGTANIVGLLEDMQAAARAAEVKQEGKDLHVALSLKADRTTLGLPLIEAVQKVRGAATRAQSVNNLKQLGLAMHNYHDTNGTFPPHAVYGKGGKPLLSWRVLVLPYVEQDALYKEFHLDEAWDSPHNKKLYALDKMPRVFASPDEKAIKAHETHYQVFFGKGAAFEGKKGLGITEFTDGTSNTILIVEAGQPVPWTKPEDLPYDPDKPLPKLGGLFAGGFNAALADGSVRFVSNKVSETTLRSAITRNGGEVLGPDF